MIILITISPKLRRVRYYGPEPVIPHPYLPATSHSLVSTTDSQSLPDFPQLPHSIMLLSRKMFLSIFAAAVPLGLVAGVKSSAEEGLLDLSTAEDPDVDVFELTRDTLTEENRGIIGDIASGLLEHSAHGATNMDKTVKDNVKKLVTLLKDPSKRAEAKEFLKSNFRELNSWFGENRVKATIMICGMGGIAFKAKTISTLISAHVGPFSKSFADPAVSWAVRGPWFVTLMVLRLFVTVAVPPLSPLFSMLVDDGMPETQQALAMPTFLLASTLAGAAPQALDLLVNLVANHVIAPCLRREEGLTSRRPVSGFMVRVLNAHPFTCWIYPGMKKVFDASRGGKIGAKSLRYAAIVAILFGHVFPFAGAGVTWAAIGITPFWSDNMLAQPFGMSEDLVGVAMNQILHGQTQIAQRGFFALNMALNGWNLPSEQLYVKAAIMVVFATGIWGILEVVEAGADPIIAQEKWGKFLLSMMTLQVFVMPFAAEGIQNMLAWASDWGEVQEEGEGHTHFVQVVDDARRPTDVEANRNEVVVGFRDLQDGAAAAPKAKAGGVLLPGHSFAEHGTPGE